LLFAAAAAADVAVVALDLGKKQQLHHLRRHAPSPRELRANLAQSSAKVRQELGSVLRGAWANLRPVGRTFAQVLVLTQHRLPPRLALPARVLLFILFLRAIQRVRERWAEKRDELKRRKERASAGLFAFDPRVAMAKARKAKREFGRIRGFLRSGSGDSKTNGEAGSGDGQGQGSWDKAVQRLARASAVARNLAAGRAAVDRGDERRRRRRRVVAGVRDRQGQLLLGPSVHQTKTSHGAAARTSIGKRVAGAVREVITSRL
jgi:hypothetical protein